MESVKEYKIGDIIEGKVTGIEDYGIFVTFGENCSGLIHISEISKSFVKNVNDYAKENSTIKAMIIEIEPNNHYKLSIKRMENKKFLKHFSSEDVLHGFDSLSENLDIWIKEALEEIDTQEESGKK